MKSLSDWIINAEYKAEPIATKENNFNKEFIYELYLITDNSKNLSVVSIIVPQLLRIIPKLTWKMIEEVNAKCENDLNKKLLKQIISEWKQIHLLEKVSEKLQEEQPVSNEILESIVDKKVDKRVKRENKKQSLKY